MLSLAAGARVGVSAGCLLVIHSYGSMRRVPGARAASAHGLSPGTARDGSARSWRSLPWEIHPGRAAMCTTLRRSALGMTAPRPLGDPPDDPARVAGSPVSRG